MKWQKRWGTCLGLVTLTLQMQIRPDKGNPGLQKQGGDWVKFCGIVPAETVLISAGR